jgi:hypothetical protein
VFEASTDGTSGAYAARFAELRRKLVESLGKDTVDVVLERGVREIAPVHPGFSITAGEGEDLRVTWQPVDTADDSGEAVRAAYSALYAAMLIILARILGREIAVRLAAAADAEHVLQGQLLGRA